MKKILIYINDSVGELDWIAPFIASEEVKEFMFYIYFNELGSNLKEKKEIFKKYGLEKKNIQLLPNDKYDVKFSKLDNFFNRGLTKIKKYSYYTFVFLRFVIDYLRLKVGLFFKKSDKFELIFRDYNLKDTISFNRFITNNKKAKIIIFPHSIAIQKKHSECPRERLKRVKADLWLENSVESNIALDMYKDVFYVSGSPTVAENYKKDKLFNSKSKNIIILTRVCLDEYGFNYEKALIEFDKLLNKLCSKGYKVLVKHHPRDNKLKFWREVQNKYDNIEEYHNSLNKIELDLKVCFTLFSSAPLFLLSRKVPIIEISPYKKCSEYNYKMPFHFCDKQGLLTHDFIDLGLYYRIKNLSNINQILDSDNLNNLSNQQFIKCKNTFPDNTNFKIYIKLKEIKNV